MFANICEIAKDVSFCVAGCAGMLYVAYFFVKLTFDMISKVYYLYRTLGRMGKQFLEYRRCRGDFDTYLRDSESKRKFWDEYYKKKYQDEAIKCTGDCSDCSKANCLDRV